LSPAARSLAWLRREGFVAAVTERWNAFAGIRQDIWGFGDLLAAHAKERIIILVQVTTRSNLASRLAKARARPELAVWIRAGGFVELHSWRKRGRRWQVKRVAIRAEDLEPVIVQDVPRKQRTPQQPELFAS
jgi:hypothetical protein